MILASFILQLFMLTIKINVEDIKPPVLGLKKEAVLMGAAGDKSSLT